MLMFLLGVLVGGLIGFTVCVICSIAGTTDRTDEQCTKNSGDSDVRSK
ncbi:MAG: hypothetical protein IJC36_00960 [Clostridia bacterium]|nr:hypothetical protein [Clostridia bacterium]